MGRGKRVDRELNRYLQRRSVLSRAYGETPSEQPPPELDAAILSEARGAVRRRPRIARSPFGGSWVVPASLAAILVLTVGLVRFTFKETGEPVSPRTAPEGTLESTSEEMLQQESGQAAGAADPGRADKPLNRKTSLERDGSVASLPAPVAKDTATVKSDAVTAEPRATAAVPPTKEHTASGPQPVPAERQTASAPARQARVGADGEEQAADKDEARAEAEQSQAIQPTAGLAAAIEANKPSLKRSAVRPNGPEALNEPVVVVTNGVPALRLPDSLVALVERAFPGYRVPDRRDLKAEWAYDPDSYPPFAAWGDFNGDGLTDVALILVSENAFKEVIFNKTARGYIAAFEVGNTFDPPGGAVPRPQRLYVSVIPEGQEAKFQRTDEGNAVRFQPEHDSVEFGIFDKRPTLVFWRDGKYEMQVIGGL